MEKHNTLSNERCNEAKRVTWIGFVINTALTVLKIFAGIIGRSEAMLADGIHSMSDFFTDIVVLIGFRFTDKPADEGHNYGHGKYETLATVVIGAALFFAGVNIFQKGVEMIYGVLFKGYILDKPGLIALLAALFSIITKEILYRYTKKVGQRIHSPAVIANGWHHRSDAFSSAGTFIGISCAYFLGDKWIIFDPIAAIVVSIFIFKVAIEIMIPAVKELLDASLEPKEVDYIICEIGKYKEIKEFHDLRTRRLGPTVDIEAHLLFDQRISLKEAHETAELLERTLEEHFYRGSVFTFHLEPFVPSESKKSKNLYIR